MTNRQRRKQRVVRAAIQWFNDLKPSGWTPEKHIHAPACNTTTDTAEKLARAVAAHLRSEIGSRQP